MYPFLKFKRQVLWVFFLFFLVCCSSRPKQAPDTLKIAIPNGPLVLDPRLASDAEGQQIGNLIYDGLIDLDQNFEIKPHLAKEWKRLGPLTYQFKLREGVLFSNGGELTSKDVLCTHQFIMDEKNASPFRGEFEKMQIEILDKYTFNIHLKEPYAPFFLLLKKGIVSCEGKEGSGAYRVNRFDPGKEVLLEANTNYFLGAPKLRFLHFDVVKDDTTRVAKLLSHEVDLVQNAIPPALIEKVLKRKGLQKMESDGITFAYVGLNLKDPILKTLNVRKALALALDRDVVIERFWKGLASKADRLLSPMHWAYGDRGAKYEYNLEEAKKLLDEAGFKDPDEEGPKTRFKLVLKTSTVKQRIELARLLAYQWGKIGVEVEVQPYEWGTFFRDVKTGQFQLYTLTWVGVTEPDLFFNVLHSKQIPPEGSNRNFYSNAEVDQLVEKGRSLLEPKERAPIYARVQEIIANELPFIPLWYEKNIAVFWDDLEGIQVGTIPNFRNLMHVTRKK